MPGLHLLDGSGSNRAATVNANNQLEVDATQVRKSAQLSADGQTYNTASVDSSAAAGDLIFYYKNDSSTREFVTDLIRVEAANAALWKVWVVTGTASGGSALTPTNMNLTSPNSADATSRGDGAISGLTTGALIAVARSVAAGAVDIPFDDTLILGNGDAIAVEYDTGTTGAAEVLMRGYYPKAE